MCIVRDPYTGSASLRKAIANAVMSAARRSRSAGPALSKSVVKIRRVAGPFGPQKQKETQISSTIYNTSLVISPGATAFQKLPDVAAVNPQTFFSMTPPRTAAGTGSNTLQSLGVWQAISGVAATATDPYQRNFWSIKIDHPGFNACDVSKFNENANQFQYVKNSAVVCEIELLEPPLSKNMPVTITRPGLMIAAQLQGYQQTMITPGGGTAGAVTSNIWNETRAVGVWQYIVIPPQPGSSINLSQIGTQAGWQRLLNMGYVPQTCRGKKYRVVAFPKGFDYAGILDVQNKLDQLNAGLGVIPASNGATGSNYMPGNHNMVHKIQETDWSCQFAPATYTDTFTGAATASRFIMQQGFDVLAFGSALVFQFCEYAPPTTTGTSTAGTFIMPYSLTVSTKTTFSRLKSSQKDVGQVSTLPIVSGV